MTRKSGSRSRKSWDKKAKKGKTKPRGKSVAKLKRKKRVVKSAQPRSARQHDYAADTVGEAAEQFPGRGVDDKELREVDTELGSADYVPPGDDQEPDLGEID